MNFSRLAKHRYDLGEMVKFSKAADLYDTIIRNVLGTCSEPRIHIASRAELYTAAEAVLIVILYYCCFS